MARPRTFDEAGAVRAAREVFHERGYADASVADLTQATGLSRSSLYGTFGDKHGLFLRAYADYCDALLRGLQEELGGDPAGARQRLERHLRSAVATTPEDRRRGCLLAKATAERAGEDAEVVATSARFYRAYERLLHDCLADARAGGDVRADLDPAEVAALLLALLRGLETLTRAGAPLSTRRAAVSAALALLDRPTPAD